MSAGCSCSSLGPAAGYGASDIAWVGERRDVQKGYHQPTMNANDRIVIDPKISHGKPVIRGTRVPVTVVVGSLANGMTFEEIQFEYDLTADDIRAALRFVGELAEQESFHQLPTA